MPLFFKPQTPKEQLSSIIHQLKNRMQECLHEDWTDYLLSCKRGQLVGKTVKGKTLVYNITDPIAECIDAEALRAIGLDTRIPNELLRMLDIPQNFQRLFGIEQILHGNSVGPQHLDNIPDTETLNNIINSSSWSRAKEHFSWSFESLLTTNSNFIEDYFNLCRKRQMYLWNLLIAFKINELVQDIDSAAPNYSAIAKGIRDIKEIKMGWVYNDGTSRMMSIEDLPIYGNNILTTFFSSIAGLLVAPVWTVLGILALPLYCASQTQYLGSPTFLLDSMKYFFNSFIDLIAIVIFPIAIYKSKETTGSYNLIKGDLLRRLNSIEDLANKLVLIPPIVEYSAQVNFVD